MIAIAYVAYAINNFFALVHLNYKVRPGCACVVLRTTQRGRRLRELTVHTFWVMLFFVS